MGIKNLNDAVGDEAVRSRLNPDCSRRDTLKWGGLTLIGVTILGPVFAAQGATKPAIIMDRAQGLVIADPLKCVACGRCELACTEFNDGKASPAMSRIKVSRNFGFGMDGVTAWREGHGNWGDGLVAQDLCKQCPHPVPCANICPENAIVLSPKGSARMVDAEKCTGCKICLKACPWEMISFDADSRKATKCHLCDGKPKCVEACPAQALTYSPWQDLTRKIPPRVETTLRLPKDRAVACDQCHLPGQGRNFAEGIALFSGAVKGGRPMSVREFGSRWIDVAGSILVPVALVSVIAHAVMRKVKK
ncbi:MAG TPA: 4Fe-4S dicluster domain-containing protein [Thermodesulfobacteriota bacterium]|nr:4Fe-4S dicluster domain-containing protein [Thermodesulfobacteriota bacterium]